MVDGLLVVVVVVVVVEGMGVVVNFFWWVAIALRKSSVSDGVIFLAVGRDTSSGEEVVLTTIVLAEVAGTGG